MKVREEIERYSKEEDKVVLLWLLDRYHLESQWQFIARCHFEEAKANEYQSRRVWTPREAGLALYNCAKYKEALEFYADPEGWKDVETGFGMLPGDTIDYGHTAQEALNETKGTR